MIRELPVRQAPAASMCSHFLRPSCTGHGPGSDAEELLGRWGLQKEQCSAVTFTSSEFSEFQSGLGKKKVSNDSNHVNTVLPYYY